MLFELILFPFWRMVDFIISLIPTLVYEFDIQSSAVEMFFENTAYALNLFGAPFFCLIVGNIIFWLTIQMAWAIIEWIYIKIPGVN